MSRFQYFCFNKEPKAPPTNPKIMKIPMYHMARIISAPAKLGLPAILKYKNAMIAIPLKAPISAPWIIPVLMLLLTRYPANAPAMINAKYIPINGTR